MKDKKEVRQEAEQIARETVDECLRLARRKASPLQPRPAWKPEVVISWAQGHTTSHGNARRVFLALARQPIRDNHPVRYFKEYARIADEPAIGSVLAPDWRDVIRILACHETAHAVQYAPRSRMGNWHSEFKKPHGPGWRRLYAYFRHETGLNAKIKDDGGIIGRRQIEAFFAAKSA